MSGFSPSMNQLGFMPREALFFLRAVTPGSYPVMSVYFVRFGEQGSMDQSNKPVNTVNRRTRRNHRSKHSSVDSPRMKTIIIITSYVADT